MRIERIHISEISASDYNPRRDLRPEDPEYQAIQRSLERWDLVEPLVWNERTGRLVSGHQRLKVLQARGDTEVDVSVVDLSETDERALSLALNKISGEWEDTKLADLLKQLEGDGFDLSLTGFDPAVLDALLKQDDMSATSVLPAYAPPQPEDAETRVDVHTVRQAEVDATQARQATRFTGQVPVREVTCPHCGQEFGLRD